MVDSMEVFSSTQELHQPRLLQATAAPTESSAAGTVMAINDFMSTLTPITNSDAYHMKPVHVVVSRVESVAPEWNSDVDRFVSPFATTTEDQFIASLDTVNAASVEGALMYVQAEGINYNSRTTDDRCTRKSAMAYIVFYEMAIVQTNETLALYQDTADQNEYGPMIPMDSGRCTPTSGDGSSAEFPTECHYFNGTNGEPNIGPFVGAELKESTADPRAPYPNNVWYSLPNSCPLQAWGDKTDECRASTRQGLCDMGVMPDGITCTFTYRVLGFLPLDDLVGITSMVSSTTGNAYSNFTEFCEDGGVEFEATTDGEWISGIPFWENPQDEDANSERASKVVEAYYNLTNGLFENSPLDTKTISQMLPLPTPAQLAASNPACYLNVEKCNSDYGCKRELYGQTCKLCSSSSDECKTAPSDWTFPTLTKALGENGGSGEVSTDSSSTSDRSFTGSTPGSSTGNTSSTTTDSGLNPGVVAAIVVGGIFLVLFILLACYCHRKRKTQTSKPDLDDNSHFHAERSPITTENSTRPAKRVNRNVDTNSNLWEDETIISWRVPREKVIVGALISRGGYGEVYRGTYNQQDVAVKMLLPETRRSTKHVNAFLAEVKMIAGLEHTRIAQFIGVAWDSFNDLCVLSELMAGGDLRALLSHYDETNEPQGFDYKKVKIALHVAHALTYLHSLELPVIHRDLKSKNVLLTPDLDAKLTDFGVSRERIDATMTAGVGTSLWMAPEIMLGEKYDVAADIFSFGVLLSELDTQKLPYSHAKDNTNSGRKLPDAAILQLMVMGSLRVDFTSGALPEMVELGVACVSTDPKTRPSASEVLYRLQKTLQQC